MDISRYTGRSMVAIVILIFAAGTALAANPASQGQQSPTTSQAVESAEPSESGERSESAEPGESAEPSESAEPTEATKAASNEASPSSAELGRVVDLLKAAGITTTTDELAKLAAQVGVGGAVRVLALAHASGKTPAEILAMFQGGMGWGQIDHQLKLSIGPGIGWIMGHGHSHPGGPHGG